MTSTNRAAPYASVGPLRATLRAGRAVGTFVKLGRTEVIDILAGAGLDFAIVDLEHSQLSDGDGLRLLRHAAAIRFPAVVRLPACDAGLVNRCLEAGAAGIQLSSVRRVQQIRELVDASRYAPNGRRSVSLSHPMAGYGAVALGDAVSAEHPLLVGQIEHGDSDDELEDILAAGLDVVFVGVTDLAVDVGFDADRVRQRVEAVRVAAAGLGITLGMFASTLEDAEPDVAYLAVSSDVALLRSAASELTHG